MPRWTVGRWCVAVSVHTTRHTPVPLANSYRNRLRSRHARVHRVARVRRVEQRVVARAPLIKYLSNLGYGSRREVEQLFAHGRVTALDGSRADPTSALSHDQLRVDAVPLDPPPGSLLALHKPVGYVCSTSDPVHRVIYDLLPPRFRARTPIMASVGRLDHDTSGLLLLTDDGALNHRLTSPRQHVPKVYVATLHDALRGDERAQFLGGSLMLAGDPHPAIAQAFEALSEHAEIPGRGARVRVVLNEGRYHQVRRMFAAAGHHVVALERVAIGGLTLADPPLNALSPGAWCELPLRVRALLEPAG